MLTRLLWVTLMILIITADLPMKFSLLGLSPLLVMWVDRVTSVTPLQHKTWKDRLIPAVILVEDLYGFFLEACAFASVALSLRARAQEW